jgi:hypothetical protein
VKLASQDVLGCLGCSDVIAVITPVRAVRFIADEDQEQRGMLSLSEDGHGRVSFSEAIGRLALSVEER